jgi:pimeloyl-ACP methyl ester carboxylesterase
MGLAMDCASGASPERRAQIERERADPANLLGDSMDAPFYASTCAPCPGDLGAAFRGPLKCSVPVLFVSGELDARTPPENVEAIRAGFAHHAHVVVTNTGHDSRELESAEYVALLQRFLSSEPVEDRTIELPPVELRPLRGR